MLAGVFDDLRPGAYPYHFQCTLAVDMLVGGVPTDPKVAEGWLRTKLVTDKDELIREAVAATMVERGVTAEEATKIVNTQKNLNGFKRDEIGLYVEGRQLKAMLKEAGSIAVAAGKVDARGWGKTNKGLLSYLSEHVFVVDKRIHVYQGDSLKNGGVAEATGINQRFVHTFRGAGIQYEEYIAPAKLTFTVISDHPFTRKQWGHIWLCAEQNGVGASRSQGYGTFTVVQWDQQEVSVPKQRGRKATVAADGGDDEE